MNKLLTLLLIITASQLTASGPNITIIESQSAFDWTYQDTIWQTTAQNMGYDAIILEQSALDHISNLGETDVLIVSSGTLTFEDTDRLQTIIDFVMSGRPVYIQGEYQITKQGNITFAEIMTTLDVDFYWEETVMGNLAPMVVSGGLASTPNDVIPLDYFHFGLAGNGDGVEKFMAYDGNYFGFCYDGYNGGGTVICISDEDWVVQSTSPVLVENILHKLIAAIPCSDYEFDTITSCEEFTWIDGQTYSENNSTATYTLTNEIGCDSIITLQLNIPEISTSLSIGSESLTAATNPGATFQWLDCADNNAAIPGATEQTFTPSESGSYAVQITLDGCVETTACYEVISTSLTSLDFKKSISVYPNPATAHLNLDLGKTYSQVQIILHNSVGLQVLKETYHQTAFIGLNPNIPAGLYFLEVRNKDGEVAVYRVVIE